MGMFGSAFSGWHLVLILFVIVLLFGAAKLPALASSVGQSLRILKKESKIEPSDAEVPEQATTVNAASVDHAADRPTAAS